MTTLTFDNTNRFKILPSVRSAALHRPKRNAPRKTARRPAELSSSELRRIVLDLLG